jgi:hypothetical protein
VGRHPCDQELQRIEFVTAREDRAVAHPVPPHRPVAFPDASSDYEYVGDPETGAHPLYAHLSDKKEQLTQTAEFDA